MKPAYTERQQLREEFPHDVDRMLLCLKEAGLTTTDDEAVGAWAEYSDDNYAGWLELPESNATLREILLRYLPSARSRAAWRITVVDALDGSGDPIISLPSELVEQMGWKAGDELSIERVDPDTLLLRRI
ncbi:AbrB/MazE/SpoVT family DNA-binding domain-containing protein [Ralstonia pseudosolanacearum]|uniref:AbrB/MazE/SpoVT family DNA-binding domain-containing protein n=1 Tax=Ralstonia pseudosolanacearum TaxID=1310165 RepID=UPI0018D14EAE|nr:AbrB/MazE/SpoVT family DNA-binding domain-containing protein [Ralstonia pseudosolanacearum]